tara:strand:+ start:29 stop:802 length:774 start_codon:yes stop_codon:yes gene_type:complete
MMSESRYTKHLDTADIGQHETQLRLSKIGIDSVPINRTYDLFLWQRDHKIEVKTANVKGRIDNNYIWSFNSQQVKQNAFDYAMCLGLDNNNDVSVYYLIPQRYIYEMKNKTDNKETGYNISIGIDKLDTFRLEGSTYDKFAICRNLNLDLFLQHHKPAFTRKKNTLTKKLLNYSINHQYKVLKEIKKVFGNKKIQWPIKELSEKNGWSKTFVNNCRKLLGLELPPPIKYKCNCGYTTKDKRDYTRHLNRKKPCEVNK